MRSGFAVVFRRVVCYTGRVNWKGSAQTGGTGTAGDDPQRIPAARPPARDLHGADPAFVFVPHGAAVRRVLLPRGQAHRDPACRVFEGRAGEQLRQTALHEYAHAAAALLTGRRHGHDAVWKSVCLRVGCRPERLSKPCAAAQERAAAYEKSRAGGPVYLVRCLGCGTESRYLRRGKIVQLLEQHPKTQSCVCKKCGGRSFSLIVEEGLR